MKGNAGFLRVRRCVLVYVHRQSTVFIFLRLEACVAWIKYASAVTLRRTVRENFIGVQRSDKIFEQSV
jgi:hypothetical protein